MLVEPGFATEVLDALPDATAILDRTGSIVAVNRAWRMFSLDNAEGVRFLIRSRIFDDVEIRDLRAAGRI